MVSLINFGESPFLFLFFLVGGVFVVTILVNVIAYIVSLLIDNRTQRIVKGNQENGDAMVG